MKLTMHNNGKSIILLNEQLAMIFCGSVDMANEHARCRGWVITDERNPNVLFRLGGI